MNNDGASRPQREHGDPRFEGRAATAWSSKADDFDIHAHLDFVLALEEFVDHVECRGVVVTLAAFPANLGIDVLHDIELAVEPVVLGAHERRS